MDTSEISLAEAELSHVLSDGSRIASSSIPSIPTLFVVALLIPAAAALSNQWLEDRNWVLHHSNLSWHHYALYPWMAFSAAAVSWSSGRYLYPLFLKCAVFLWCLVLLDLLTFMASLGDTRNSQFGYMLVSAQINLLILWTILGPGGWQWRLPLMIAIAPIVILLSTTIGSTWWMGGGHWYSGGGWFAESWNCVVLLAAIVAALLCIGLRWLGFSLRLYRSAKCDTDSRALRMSQFGVKHMLVWSAAIVPLLLIARSLDFLFLTKVKQNEFFPITLLSLSLATVSLVAIWVVLGAGRWFVRVPLLFLVPIVTTVALEAYSRSMVSQFGPYSSYKRPMADLFVEMAGNWLAWIWPGTALLAALLLFIRASGYRFVRNVQTVAPPA
jgi:hypothetical protein